MYSGTCMQKLHMTADEILHSVVKSGCLGNSVRQHDILKYLLDEAEFGRTHRIKAYSIAIDVLGRDEGFDNNTDSIVRVEMHRLRKNLTTFNSGANTFTLEIPKATYKIIKRSKPNTDSKRAASMREKPKPDYLTITVLAAIMVGALVYAALKPGLETTAPLAQACSMERPNLLLAPTIIVGNSNFGKDTALIIDNYLHTGLSQYSMINLVSGSTNCKRAGTPVYRVKTEIFGAADQPFISVIAQHATTEKIVFSERIDLPVNSKVVTQEDSWKFYKIASKLAHSSGVLPQDATHQTWVNAIYKNTYLCQTMAYKYFSVITTGTDYRDAVTCMETALKNGVTNPDIHGLLAMFYMEQARGYQPAYTDDPLVQADKILTWAEKTTPLNTEVLLARLRLESERVVLDKERVKYLLYALERQQPYNPHMLIFVAQIAGFKLGDWPYAQEISQRTLRIDRTHIFAAFYVQLAHALLFSDPQTAYEVSLNLYEPKSIISVLMCLASANKAGINTDVVKYKTDLASLGLTSQADYTDFITARNYEPNLSAELIQWVSAE